MFRDAPIPPTSVTPTRTLPRLHFLDGLRGLAAFYVLHHHVMRVAGFNYDCDAVPAALLPLLRIFISGHYAVVLFIVISGYSLMLPIAAGRAKLELGTFIMRRVRRIVPAYYAALLFSALLIFLVPKTHGSTVNFTAGSIVSHLLLIHNWFPQYIHTLNGPAWSIATEWQIYLLMPLLLLPIRRWLGDAGLIVTACALGGAAALVLGEQVLLACPWFIAPFAMGMAAAMIVHGSGERSTRPLPWGGITVALALILWTVIAYFPRITWYAGKGGSHEAATAMFADLLAGMAAASLLIYCGRCHTQGKASTPVLRMLESRPAVFLGISSYSLYLLHMPVLRFTHALIDPLELPRKPMYLALLLITAAIGIPLSRAWYRLFEAPFMKSPHATRPPRVLGLAGMQPAKSAAAS